MSKAAEAFRTIGEVADDLDVKKHVLRFWEGKFPAIKPMKRGGGRRYYRPEDMALLRGIRHLLHAEGYTIKGVQRLLREEGIDRVKEAAPPVDVERPTEKARRGRRPIRAAASPAKTRSKPRQSKAHNGVDGDAALRVPSDGPSANSGAAPRVSAVSGHVAQIDAMRAAAADRAATREQAMEAILRELHDLRRFVAAPFMTHSGHEQRPPSSRAVGQR